MTLQNAAFIGDLARVIQLVQSGSSLEEQDSNGETALHTAIENLRKEIIEYLLKVGANVEGDTKGGLSPLLHAIAIETDVASQRHAAHPTTTITGLLIDHGANVNRRCGIGVTPIEFAVKLRNEAARALLIAKGAKA